MDMKCEMFIPSYFCYCGIPGCTEDDKFCKNESSGITEDNVRVCVPCGIQMEEEQFYVKWDVY